ncbi:MAG: hypothetical protein AB7C97_01795 [Oscillospiraceae bacterium]
MPDYKKMYAILCGAISDALDTIRPEGNIGPVSILLKAINETEDIYIEAED